MSQRPASYEPYTPGRPGPEQPWRPSNQVEHQVEHRVEHRGEHEVQRAGSCRPSYGGAPDCLVVASVICVVIWAMSGGGYFWPIWVLLPTLMPVVLRTLGRRKN